MSIASNITRIANAKEALKTAINAKGGTLTSEKIDQYAAAVDALEPADGFGNRVRFFDYDGTLLKTMYVADGEDATPPATPVHSGLTFEGWNNDYTDVTGDVDVGAMYSPTSGKTEIDVRIIFEGRNYTLNFTITSGTLTVDWGDGTSTSSISSTGTLPHTYAAQGEYTITISASSGAEWQPGQYFCNGGNSSNEYCTRAVRFYGITTLSNYALCYCKGLTDIIIPPSVTSIYDYACNSCSSLRCAVIPNSVATVGGYAFADCESLLRIVWPESAEDIPGSCFKSCRALADIIIPNGVETVSGEAFYGCNALSEAYLPDSITSIGSDAFRYCYGLSKLRLSSSLISLPSSCFYGCHALQTVDIPSGVTVINSSCFDDCFGLRSVTLPSSLAQIKSQAFSDCYGISAIELPTSLISIESYAFQNCSLQRLVIPSAVTSIGGYAFYCPGLLDVSVLPSTPPTAGNSSIFGNNENRRITVPAASLTDYKNASGWSGFEDYIFAAD